MAIPRRIDGTRSRPGHTNNIDPLQPATDKGFKFLENYGVKKGSDMKYVNYKPARLVKAHDKWYITYSYRVPDQLKKQYKSGWVRFRIYEDINRYKSDQYASELLDAVNLGLANGFNPFDKEIKQIETNKEASLNRSLDEFLTYCEHKGLRPKTIGAYRTSVTLLKEYFIRDNIIYQPPGRITADMLEEFFMYQARQKKWSARTYNNYVSDIGTIFQWMVRKKKLIDNPTEEIEFKKTVAHRNRYYDDATADKLKALIEPEDPQLYLFLEMIYYTCTRPKSETRLIKVKYILFERDMLFIPGTISKNKRDDYIPLAPELKAKLLAFRSLSPETYLFGLSGPADKPVSQNVMSRRFKEYKDRLGLGEDYSTYSFKHTRAVHLANAGVSPYDIMKLMRHSGLDITMSYLRDLGCEVDWNKYNIDKTF